MKLNLNPEQLQAVKHSYGPLLVLAGAGSGKTSVLVARTERLITEGLCRADQICVLTFTNKSARELKHRVQQRIGDIAKGVWAGTFHSFGLSLIRAHHEKLGLPKRFTVMDSSDVQAMLKDLVKHTTVVGKDKYDLDVLANLIGDLRVHGKTRVGIQKEYADMAEMIAPRYQNKKRVQGAVDFEDLLLMPLELCKDEKILKTIQSKYRFWMVDEFQDTNVTQMELLKKWTANEMNLCVVGDDDQSIYGWRGAEVKNILNFPKLYKNCPVIRLERNYRSQSAILNLANAVIQKNTVRHGKVLFSANSSTVEIPECFVCENEDAEADFVAREIQSFIQSGGKPKDIAVLYRSNSQGGLIESILRQNRIPYSVSGGTAFFDRKEVKDVFAYIKLSSGLNELSLRRVLNVPSRGIGDTSLEKLNEHCLHSKKNFVQALRDWSQAGLHPQAGESIERYLASLEELRSQLLTSPEKVSQVLKSYFGKIGYREYLASHSSDPQALERRWSSVEIVGQMLNRFFEVGGRSEASLDEFIQAMELRDDAKDEEEKNEVSLMTFHAAKGLEFPLVFIIGVEEELIPHRSLGTDVEEERRLFYVGITRAKSKLIMSRCETRQKYGQPRAVAPSRFLLEAPAEMLRSYPNEWRPVTENQREAMLAAFMAKTRS